MSNFSKKAPAVFLNSALELEELENEIRSALVRIWVIQGLVLITGVVAIALIVAHQIYR